MLKWCSPPSNRGHINSALHPISLPAQFVRRALPITDKIHTHTQQATPLKWRALAHASMARGAHIIIIYIFILGRTRARIGGWPLFAASSSFIFATGGLGALECVSLLTHAITHFNKYIYMRIQNGPPYSRGDARLMRSLPIAHAKLPWNRIAAAAFSTECVCYPSWSCVRMRVSIQMHTLDSNSSSRSASSQRVGPITAPRAPCPLGQQICPAPICI